MQHFRNWTGLVLICIALTAWTQCRSSEQSTVTKDEVVLLAPERFLAAYKASPSAYLIDCRTPVEAKEGTLEGARVYDFHSAGFRDSLGQLDTTREVFVYCAAGGRSAQAALLLDSFGFSRVVDLEGGYRAVLQSE